MEQEMPPAIDCARFSLREPGSWNCNPTPATSLRLQLLAAESHVLAMLEISDDEAR